MNHSGPNPARSLWPLLSLLGVIFVMGVVLTQVDLSEVISPLLAGRRPGTPASSSVMGVMLVVLIGVPVVALALMIRSLKRQNSSQVREEGKSGP